jgi:hypothetical protein
MVIFVVPVNESIMFQKLVFKKERQEEKRNRKPH